MAKYLLLMLLFFSTLFGEYPDSYKISYGDDKAPLRVRQYVAFDCDVCHAFYRKSFPKIKADYIDKKRVHWEFIPFLNDIKTLKAMICLKELNLGQKKAFFELIFPHSIEQSDERLLLAMQTVMQGFEKELPELEDRKQLIDSSAMQESIAWQKTHKIDLIPRLEIDGQIIEGDLSYKELTRLINESIRRNFS